MQPAGKFGITHRGVHPGEGAGLHFGKGFINELGQKLEGFFHAALPHQVDHAHVPLVAVVALGMLFGHVLGQLRFFMKMPVGQGVAGQQDGTTSGLADGLPRGATQKVHLALAFLGVKEIRRVVGGYAHHRNVPLRSDHVQRGDRSVVGPELRVAHHLADQAKIGGLFAARLGQFDVHVHAEVITEYVGEDRVDRSPGKPWHAQKVVPDLGNPMRGMHQQHVRLHAFNALACLLIRPAQRFPAAFRPRLVLRRVFAVDQMRGMRRQEAGKNHSFTHGEAP